MIDETPYTKEEIIRFGQALPERGLPCPKCGVVIPQFADLDDKVRFRLKNLLLQGQNMMAHHELRAATGCSVLWAKIWITHKGQPEYDVGTITPCPYCGQPLRTPLAKQCRHCLQDWHDETDVGNSSSNYYEACANKSSLKSGR